jgi:hypothetical protein
VAGALLSPLQNFDGFMAIMNAANDSSIYRLKKTWGRLPSQARDLWHDLKKLTEKGARSLNKLTKETTPPLIPYMGVLIQNVLALQEYPDRIEGDLINFKKVRSDQGRKMMLSWTHHLPRCCRRFDRSPPSSTRCSCSSACRTYCRSKSVSWYGWIVDVCDGSSRCGDAHLAVLSPGPLVLDCALCGRRRVFPPLAQDRAARGGIRVERRRAVTRYLGDLDMLKKLKDKASHRNVGW